jgi:phasin family protein
MAESDHNIIPVAPNMDLAVKGLNIASKNLHVLASEVADYSRHSYEQAVQVFDQLRTAGTVDEFVAIQTNFMKDAFQTFTESARRIAEIMASLPRDITKTHQDNIEKTVDNTVRMVETAAQTVAHTGH